MPTHTHTHTQVINNLPVSYDGHILLENNLSNALVRKTFSTPEQRGTTVQPALHDIPG